MAINQSFSQVQIACLLFHRRVALQALFGDEHAEQQKQLGMLFYLGLAKNRTRFRPNAGAQPFDDHVDGILVNLGSVRVGGQNVIISDQVVVFKDLFRRWRVHGLLQFNPIFQRADIVTEMQAARRPHAAENSFFDWVHIKINTDFMDCHGQEAIT